MGMLEQSWDLGIPEQRLHHKNGEYQHGAAPGFGNPTVQHNPGNRDLGILIHPTDFPDTEIYGTPRFPFIPGFHPWNSQISIRSRFFWARSSSRSLRPFPGFSGRSSPVIPGIPGGISRAHPELLVVKRIWENPRKSFGIQSCPGCLSQSLGSSKDPGELEFLGFHWEFPEFWNSSCVKAWDSQEGAPSWIRTGKILEKFGIYGKNWRGRAAWKNLGMSLPDP